MITQKIIARTDSLKLDKIISRYGEDSMRQVVFIIVRPDPESEDLIPITIPEDAVGSFRILKPSGNFIIVPMSKSVLASGETAFDVVLPASANTAKGSGYYDIRITSDTDKYYFTAQGDFIIDDNIISDEVLEDVSEVNGLIFPDDFLTVDDNLAVIDDNTISNDSTWSSEKISDQINIIDDNTVSTNNTWSSEKINDEIKDNSGKHEYSTNEKVVGTWIDGNTVYEQTFASPMIGEGSYGDITISNLDSVISFSGISGEGTPIPYLDTGGNYGFVGWYKITDGVRITTGSHRRISAGYVTIRYTKITPTYPSNLLTATPT